MISGIVTSDFEARVRIKLRGPNAIEADLEAVIDTGFTDSLTLPRSWVDALALASVNTDTVTLADGTAVVASLYEVELDWDSRRRSVMAHCLEGDSLIGMALLKDYLLTVQVVDGGAVTISELPSTTGRPEPAAP